MVMRISLLSLLGIFPLLFTWAPVRASDTYRFLKEIPIGGEGGWDYISIDEANRRLFVTHATKVVVVDLDTDKIVGEITDTPGVHGFALAPELGRGFASNGRENKVSIVDLKTLQTLAKVETGENPDAILFEPTQSEVYAFNGRGKSATVFEAKTGRVVTTIPLPGKPEFATTDAQAGRVFCNIEDKSVVVVIDIKTHAVVNTWPIAPGESASGMAIDLAHHRLFLGCENNLMVMMDSVTGKVIASVPIGSRVDANAFDPVTQLAFSSNGEGNVTIAHEDKAAINLTVVQTLATAPGARTMTLDPRTHRIYLPTATLEPVPGGRPKVLPGTMKILVFGPE